MLLLTNRPVSGRRLQGVMGAIEPCTMVGPGDTAAASTLHNLIVCDAALDDPATLKAVRSLLAIHRRETSLPLLYLSGADDAEAVREGAAIGATAVLHRGSSSEQVLFTVKQMIAVRRRAAPSPTPTVSGVRRGVGVVASAFGRLFEASERDRPLVISDIERAEEALISTVRQGSIDVWLEIVRTYDDTTYQHCLSVAGLATKFAMELGLTARGQRLVARSALVHDIGKARIPRAVLCKAGPLAPSEMELMREHPKIGHGMLLSQGGFDPQVLDVARHHHEYVDGTGYPDALRGEQVKPLVRLVTICDVYAAMIEHRPYKTAVPPRDALAALTAMGSRLDRTLLALFSDMILSKTRGQPDRHSVSARSPQAVG